MKYKILSATSTEELERLVTEYLADGWSPAGGIQAIVPPSGPWDRSRYLQALTKQVGSKDTATPRKARETVEA